MTKKIVFSSSDYSESSEIEMLPKATEKKPFVVSSDESEDDFVISPQKQVSRPIQRRNVPSKPIKRGPVVPQASNKITHADQTQNISNQSMKQQLPNGRPHSHIKSDSSNSAARKRPIPPPNTHSNQELQSNRPKPQKQTLQNSNSRPIPKNTTQLDSSQVSATTNEDNHHRQTTSRQNERRSNQPHPQADNHIQKQIPAPHPKFEIEQDSDSDSYSNSDEKQSIPPEQRSPKIHNISHHDNDSSDDTNAVIRSPMANIQPKEGSRTSNQTPTKVQKPITIFSPKTFSIQRIKKHSILGSNYTFILIRNGQPFLYSKCNARHPKSFMNLSEDSTFTKLTEYTFIPENSCKKFTLYKSGKTQLIYTIEIPNRVTKLPRLKIQLEDSFEFNPKVLVSKRPTMSKKGFFFLDFHNKFTLPSQKNAVFINDSPNGDDNDLLIVRKVEKDRIEIDVNCEQNELLIFSLGLSTFLGKMT